MLLSSIFKWQEGTIVRTVLTVSKKELLEEDVNAHFVTSLATSSPPRAQRLGTKRVEGLLRAKLWRQIEICITGTGARST